MTIIDQKYAELGGPSGLLGPAVVPEMLASGGAFRTFQKGMIAWFPATGAHEVHGLILKKWGTFGHQGGLLGFPTTDQSSTEGGRYNLFQRGVILYKSNASEAFEVHGAIHQKYITLNSENGILGFPTSDERFTPSQGRFSKFDRGSIYWKPSVGAHEVHGLIHKYWEEAGRETNPTLGYPITDEMPSSPGSRHAFSDFENGVVYWKSGSPAAIQLMPNALLSRPASTVTGEMSKGIQDALKGFSTNLPVPGLKLEITFGPSFVTMKDYEQVGGSVRNRQYVFVVGAALVVPGTNDPDFTLTLNILVRYNRTKHSIDVILKNWKLKSDIDFPTSLFATAEQFNAAIAPKLNALAATPLSSTSIPDSFKFNVLSVKPMPNGDLNCYTEP
jgi:hypothetical protein